MRRAAAGIAGGVLAGALLLGCVAPRAPVAAAGTDPTVTPGAVLARPAGNVEAPVLWGGGIIAVENLPTGARLEVMAYPLGPDQRPRREGEPYGRVLVRRDGYLEPLDYRQGRSVTFRGRVVDVAAATVGGRTQRVPVVRAEALHLWPEERQPGGRLPFSVHFGVFIGN